MYICICVYAKSLSFLFKGPPTAPAVHVVSKNSTAITVAIIQSVSNGGAEVTYSFHYRAKVHDSYTRKNISTAEELVTISSLHSDMEYKLFAQASNRYGSTNSTPLVKVNTDEAGKH